MRRSTKSSEIKVTVRTKYVPVCYVAIFLFGCGILNDYHVVLLGLREEK